MYEYVYCIYPDIYNIYLYIVYIHRVQENTIIIVVRQRPFEDLTGNMSVSHLSPKIPIGFRQISDKIGF